MFFVACKHILLKIKFQISNRRFKNSKIQKLKIFEIILWETTFSSFFSHHSPSRSVAMSKVVVSPTDPARRVLSWNISGIAPVSETPARGVVFLSPSAEEEVKAWNNSSRLMTKIADFKAELAMCTSETLFRAAVMRSMHFSTRDISSETVHVNKETYHPVMISVYNDSLSCRAVSFVCFTRMTVVIVKFFESTHASRTNIRAAERYSISSEYIKSLSVVLSAIAAASTIRSPAKKRG